MARCSLHELSRGTFYALSLRLFACADPSYRISQPRSRITSQTYDMQTSIHVCKQAHASAASWQTRGDCDAQSPTSSLYMGISSKLYPRFPKWLACPTRAAWSPECDAPTPHRNFKRHLPAGRKVPSSACKTIWKLWWLQNIVELNSLL